MSNYQLDFELPLKTIEDKINELKSASVKTGVDVTSAIEKLTSELLLKQEEIYANLSRWERVQLARHPNRPHSIDIINSITDYWFEMHGDRAYGDDKAIIAGLATIENFNVAIIAQEKGRSTKEKVFRNFGMPKPEGYRKAARVMRLAEQFSLPVITFIDTPGAYPGIGAEERGQAEAIASNLLLMSTLKTPIVSFVIGEGASGGALGIGLADRIICFENTWYSVISPEGCASILFRDPARASEAADSMRVTASDLFDLGIADKIIPEPVGGAHMNHEQTAIALKESIIEELISFKNIEVETILKNRLRKYEQIGSWDE